MRQQQNLTGMNTRLFARLTPLCTSVLRPQQRSVRSGITQTHLYKGRRQRPRQVVGGRCTVLPLQSLTTSEFSHATGPRGF